MTRQGYHISSHLLCVDIECTEHSPGQVCTKDTTQISNLCVLPIPEQALPAPSPASTSAPAPLLIPCQLLLLPPAASSCSCPLPPALLTGSHPISQHRLNIVCPPLLAVEKYAKFENKTATKPAGECPHGPQLGFGNKVQYVGYGAILDYL